MEIGDYPSVIGVKVEIRAGGSADEEFAEKFSHVIGLIRRETHDFSGSRYFIVELSSPVEGVRFLTVTERHAGASIPREFLRRPENPVSVMIGSVIDESVLGRDTFDSREVEYFAIGEVRRID